jgi:ribosome-binding factor A
MRRDEEGAGHRHLRVQSLILEELRALLRDDVSDPDLADVRIVAVVLSVDYRNARVHVVLTSQGGVTPPSPLRALARAAPYLRARLAEAIEMKRVPDLRFVLDAVGPADDPEGSARSE